MDLQKLIAAGLVLLNPAAVKEYVPKLRAVNRSWLSILLSSLLKFNALSKWSLVPTVYDLYTSCYLLEFASRFTGKANPQLTDMAIKFRALIHQVRSKSGGQSNTLLSISKADSIQVVKASNNLMNALLLHYKSKMTDSASSLLNLINNDLLNYSDVPLYVNGLGKINQFGQSTSTVTNIIGNENAKYLRSTLDDHLSSFVPTIVPSDFSVTDKKNPIALSIDPRDSETYLIQKL